MSMSFQQVISRFSGSQLKDLQHEHQRPIGKIIQERQDFHSTVIKKCIKVVLLIIKFSIYQTV